MTEYDEFLRVCGYLGHHLGGIMKRLPPQIVSETHEIRLRIQRPVVLFNGRTHLFLQMDGSISPQSTERNYLLSPKEMQDCFRMVCEYSVHSFQEEIRQGFITIRGGHRVGLSGTCISDQDRMCGMKDISSLNIRLARQIKGVADPLVEKLFDSGLISALIIGGVGSGKTTLLRDAVRQLSNGCTGTPLKVAVIDERGELSATHQGVAQNDIGEHTDVYHLYPKAVGMSMALRTLSPHVIVCDEIGREDDISALLESMNTGVAVLATAHGNTLRDVLQRDKIARFIRCGGFQRAVVLEGYHNPCAVKSIEFLTSQTYKREFGVACQGVNPC